MVKMIQSAEELKQLINGDQLVVIDFFAEWCGPCKMIAPYIASLEPQFPNVIFVKVDVDALQQVAAEHEIMAMPTFHFYRKGQRLEEFRGANGPKLLELVRKYAAE